MSNIKIFTNTIALMAALLASFSFLILPSTPSQAEAVVQTTETVCEFHIFPVTEFGVLDITQSSMGGIVPELFNGAFRIRNPDEIAEFLRESVPIKDEIAIFKSIDLKSTLKGKNSNIVVHDVAHSGDYPKKSAPPVIANPPFCYKELILIKFYFEKGTMHKGIRTAYSYRSFKGNALSEKAKAWNVGVGISHFPPKNLAEEDQARIAVRDAYRANLLEILNKK
jgi:hypothetical protein